MLGPYFASFSYHRQGEAPARRTGAGWARLGLWFTSHGKRISFARPRRALYCRWRIAMIHRTLASIFGFILASIFVPFFGILALSDTALAQTGGPTQSPPGAAVYFIGLKDGDTLPTKSTIHFGLRGMGVAPAGSDRANSGHHHLMVDVPTPALDHEIPNDFQHLHFGAGQTETELTLTPGEHTLQLVFGDKNHVPHSPPVVSARIKVKVADQTSPQAQAQAPAPAPTAAGGSAKRHPSPK